jgi:2,3-bisphosphoglycerate-independent phosphoglycerate mutase
MVALWSESKMVEGLAPHPQLKARPGPVVLCILDGVGIGAGERDDAVSRANTPTLDSLRASCPWTSLRAHGVAVGLPSDKDMGNSEVGHNAMGAGRVFDQGAKLVDQAIAAGTIFASEVWRNLTQTRTLHFLGLVSDGNVHSHVEHLRALIQRAATEGVSRCRIHVLTDGRDVSARSALTWVEPLEAELAALSTEGRDYRIASGGGRMHITMDRYQADWAMVERGWRCHVHGEGRQFSSASAAIKAAYTEDRDINDQFMNAFVVADEGGPVGPIRSGDGVCFFNFRGDRAIEISQAFEDEDFTHFERTNRPHITYAGMMQYDGDLLVPKRYLVAPPGIDRTMGEYLAASGLHTFACSETQKYGHVTFFYNGNRSGKFDETLETYLEVPSDNLPFDQRPQMKAAEITDAVIDAIHSGRYDHVRLNLANGDMVGHTGNLEATILAIETIDRQVKRLVEAVHKADGLLFVTADHGNADEMFLRNKGVVLTDAEGDPLPRTSHTLNPVPFIIVDPRGELGVSGLEDAGLASIAATVIEACGHQAPADYEPSLIAPLRKS